MPDRRCQHQSSSYVPQLLTTHWRVSVFYVQRNSNFFVLQLYYNIANSLGAQLFANKQQINNTCTWHISASTTGECSACKRCDLQPSYTKDLGSSSGCGTVSQTQLSCKKRGYSGVTGASAKALTLSNGNGTNVSATFLCTALLSHHQCTYSSCYSTWFNPRTSLNVSTRLSKHNSHECCQHSQCTVSLFSVIITLCNI